MVRIGSALFNADHTRLGEELRRVEAAGIDFLHLDVFDGYFVPDQAFPARTIKWLRPLTRLPFEVHLAVNDPIRFLPALADAGVDLVFLPAESTVLIYETIFAARERGLKVGLCLALGTTLGILPAALPMLDSILLLGRVTGEGHRGRDFNALVVDRVREVRKMIDVGKHSIDLQAAGGLEPGNCVEVCDAGVTSLPLGAALHREADMRVFVSHLRQQIDDHLERRAIQTGNHTASSSSVSSSIERGPVVSEVGTKRFKVFVASRSFGKNCPEVLETMRSCRLYFPTRTSSIELQLKKSFWHGFRKRMSSFPVLNLSHSGCWRRRRI